ncbi:MAG: beta-ketoacyl-ACP synthase II [Thermoleophilaceae bacterium]|nr:beta-ketoacyl-ACP synthase II [Thermoleophilaceae bacterium]
MSRRVVVTGVGAVTPLGVGAPALIDRWTAGECGIEDGMGRCDAFDPADLLSRKEVRRSDRFTQLALIAAGEALEQAGWEDGAIEPERAGCLIGTGIGGIGTIEANHTVLTEQGPRKVSALSIPMLMANAAAGSVAMRHQLKGQCYGTVSACAAGAHAIGAGMRMVQYGDADACVVGGSESALTPLSIAAFGVMAATSPTGMSRPFDARRDGFVMGEGAGVLVLEAEEVALARGAQPLGYVTGYGATADAHHITAPEPSGEGAARAIRAALADAGVEPEDLVYVNAHGTSTPMNDRAETEAIKAALGDHAPNVPVTSTKSAIGHLLGAAGAVEAVATLLALRAGVVPPTIGWAEADEGMDLDYSPQAKPMAARTGADRELAPVGAASGPGVANGASGSLPDEDSGGRIGISNSFGFGGHNAVICMEAS